MTTTNLDNIRTAVLNFGVNYQLRSRGLSFKDLNEFRDHLIAKKNENNVGINSGHPRWARHWFECIPELKECSEIVVNTALQPIGFKNDFKNAIFQAQAARNAAANNHSNESRQSHPNTTTAQAEAPPAFVPDFGGGPFGASHQRNNDPPSAPGQGIGGGGSVNFTIPEANGSNAASAGFGCGGSVNFSNPGHAPHAASAGFGCGGSVNLNPGNDVAPPSAFFSAGSSFTRTPVAGRAAPDSGPTFTSPNNFYDTPSRRQLFGYDNRSFSGFPGGISSAGNKHFTSPPFCMGSLGGEIDNISNLSQPSGLPGGASSVLEPSKDELSTEFLSAEDITIRVKLPDALKGLTTNTTFANDQFKFIADNNPDAAQATIEAVYAFNGSISDNYRDMLIEEKNKHQKSISEAEQSVEDSKGRIEAAKKRVEELKDDAAAGKKSVANDVKRRLRSLEHEYEVRSEEIKAHGEKLKKAYDVDLEGANNQLEMLKKGHSNLEKEVDKRHKIQRETYGLALDHHTLLKTGADLVSKIQKAARANELGADHPLKQYCQHYYRMIGTHNAKVHKIDCGEFNQEAVVGEFNQEAAVEEDDSEL